MLRTSGFPYLDEAPAVLAMAHRGGRTGATAGKENSLIAFEAARGLGYRYLETDVHATRDGELVAFHDSSLSRMCAIPGEINDLTYAEVSAARIGGSDPIPRLIDLWEALPDARFNIDLKDDLAVRPLAQLIADHAAQDRVLVGSFSAVRLRAFRKLAGPAVPTAAHPGEVAAFLLLPSPIARSLNRANALQIPHRYRGRTIASARLIRSAHRAGVPVHVWTVNDAAEMTELLDRGVDGIITDETELLRAVLVDRGEWLDEESPR